MIRIRDDNEAVRWILLLFICIVIWFSFTYARDWGLLRAYHEFWFGMP